MIYYCYFFSVTETGFHIILIKCIAWMYCKLLWVKVSAKWIHIKYLQLNIYWNANSNVKCLTYILGILKCLLCTCTQIHMWSIFSKVLWHSAGAEKTLNTFLLQMCVTYCSICSPVLSCKSVLEVPTLFPKVCPWKFIFGASTPR